MGCDIHCYVEYKAPKYERWDSFGGKIYLPRSYSTFARLAGVRNYDEVTPVVPPRGMPEDCSTSSKFDNWLYITDEKGDGNTTSEYAKLYVEKYGSTYLKNHQGVDTWVSNPYWHTHSWLTTGEWEQAISETEVVEYCIVLAILKAFEQKGYQTRVVFWFDN